MTPSKIASNILSESPYHTQASRYALRELAGTDLLAFRAVAERGFLENLSVLDLGCGAGRSTRFLTALGNRVTGVDISPEMIANAREFDSSGDYRLLSPEEPLPFADASFDAFFSSWMVVEIPSAEKLAALFREAARVIRPGGHGFVLTNTPGFYQGRWFSCDVSFPENRPPLRSGQRVRVVLQPEGVDLRDYFWSDADYRSAFAEAGLEVSKPCFRWGDPKTPSHGATKPTPRPTSFIKSAGASRRSACR